MGPREKLAARAKAVESLTRLYSAAQDCLAAHVKAGLPPPREVSMLMTWGQEEARAEAQTHAPKLLSIPSPRPIPERGWISVPITVALPTTVVTAILGETSPLTVGEVVDKVRGLGLTSSEGSIQNIGTKLDVMKKIQRSASGWRLTSPETAPRIIGDRIWGLPEWLQPQDVAAHRREAVMAYMTQYGRLSRSQIIQLLTQTDWVNAPISADVLKADLQALLANKLIRRAKSDDPRNWDWEIVTKKKGALRLASAAS